MSFRRFVMSFRRFDSSTPGGYNLPTLHECLADSMHLYMTRLFIICSVLTENVENGFFEELSTAQHRIRVKSSE